MYRTALLIVAILATAVTRPALGTEPTDTSRLNSYRGFGTPSYVDSMRDRMAAHSDSIRAAAKSRQDWMDRDHQAWLRWTNPHSAWIQDSNKWRDAWWDRFNANQRAHFDAVSDAMMRAAPRPWFGGHPWY
ncbi:MAG: hypothetical protein KDH88_19150 [Chromatiales bacterium]|nr:hypothetical protein [Chromatiales bacterium]